MRSFEIRGINRQTRRRNKRLIEASSEAQARELAEQQGLQVIMVAELPPAPPTEDQLRYAGDLVSVWLPHVEIATCFRNDACPLGAGARLVAADLADQLGCQRCGSSSSMRDAG